MADAMRSSDYDTEKSFCLVFIAQNGVVKVEDKHDENGHEERGYESVEHVTPIEANLRMGEAAIANNDEENPEEDKEDCAEV
jgi:hypothetical protein